MNVVSDTSPLMNLAVVGKLEILQKLYRKLQIPKAVEAELRALPDEGARRALQEASWIHVQEVQDRRLVEALQLELDKGEAEAIALAVERSADLLLMDELEGRRVAERLRVRTLGVLGVLLHAKREKIIRSVRPILDDLIQKAGFWVGQELYARVLREAGEEHGG